MESSQVIATKGNDARKSVIYAKTEIWLDGTYFRLSSLTWNWFDSTDTFPLHKITVIFADKDLHVQNMVWASLLFVWKIAKRWHWCRFFGGESHLKKNKLPNFSHLIFFGNSSVVLQTEKTLQACASRHIYWSCTKVSSKLKSAWGGYPTLFLHYKIENKNSGVEAF